MYEDTNIYNKYIYIFWIWFGIETIQIFIRMWLDSIYVYICFRT